MAYVPPPLRLAAAVVLGLFSPGCLPPAAPDGGDGVSNRDGGQNAGQDGGEGGGEQGDDAGQAPIVGGEDAGPGSVACLGPPANDWGHEEYDLYFREVAPSEPWEELTRCDVEVWIGRRFERSIDRCANTDICQYWIANEYTVGGLWIRIGEESAWADEGSLAFEHHRHQGFDYYRGSTPSGAYEVSCGLNYLDLLACTLRRESPDTGTFTTVAELHLQEGQLRLRPDLSMEVVHDPPLACGDAPPQPCSAEPALSAGGDVACLLGADCSVRCWGDDDDGEPGAPPIAFHRLAPKMSGKGGCGIAAGDSTVVCWGTNDYGQVSLPALAASDVARASHHTLVLLPDGGLYCQGWDGLGQCNPSPHEGGYASITAGGALSCAVGNDGSAHCWGWVEDGEVSPPDEVFTEVSAGGEHACGVLADTGTLFCWGNHDVGQLAYPAGTYRNVRAGGSTTCALRDPEGDVYCWGGAYGTPSTPVLVGPFIDVAVGQGFGCALRVDGAVECWGDNDVGQATPPCGLGPPAP